MFSADYRGMYFGKRLVLYYCYSPLAKESRNIFHDFLMLPTHCLLDAVNAFVTPCENASQVVLPSTNANNTAEEDNALQTKDEKKCKIFNRKWC